MSNNNSSFFGLLPSTPNDSAGQTMSGQAGGGVWRQILDWRILLLAGVVLSIAFTLMSAGLSSLKQNRK
ncbi:MAG: hypothetical protein Fur002_21280 [Anaerolineales bacterium]